MHVISKAYGQIRKSHTNSHIHTQTRVRAQGRNDHIKWTRGFHEELEECLE